MTGNADVSIGGTWRRGEAGDVCQPGTVEAWRFPARSRRTSPRCYRDSTSSPTLSPHLVDELAEAVLAEVGRIALSAIALEDVAYSVCRSVKPRHGPFDEFPIGARTDEALGDLAEEECPES